MHENAEQTKSERMQTAKCGMSPQPSNRLWFSWLRNALLSETAICANRSKSRLSRDETEAPRIAVLLALVAGGMRFVHVTFGIIIFSSLQFISVWDVSNNILWRYVVTSAFFRLLLIMEISGLRANADAGLMPTDPYYIMRLITRPRNNIEGLYPS